MRRRRKIFSGPHTTKLVRKVLVTPRIPFKGTPFHVRIEYGIMMSACVRFVAWSRKSITFHSTWLWMYVTLDLFLFSSRCLSYNILYGLT